MKCTPCGQPLSESLIGGRTIPHWPHLVPQILNALHCLCCDFCSFLWHQLGMSLKFW
jgi:hypothetical protein